jgi:hypothetical protein
LGYDYRVRIEWKAENLSGKTIKYCTFEVVGYNAVGDKLDTKTFKETGPIEPGDMILVSFYDGDSGDYWSGAMEDVARVEITNITLEYMDGTKETGYYGYSAER